MAINARFEADFSSFLTAVDQAEVKLVDFQSGAGRVEASLSRMVDNFSGRKVIQDATLMAEAVDRVGGASSLTEGELAKVGAKAQEAADKLRAMGQDVPPKIQAIADAVGHAHESFSGFINGLNLQDALSHPLETAEAGAEAFAASLGPIGIGLAAVTAGTALWGKELLSVTEHAAAMGGALNDMSDKTGIAVPALSNLSAASQIAGSSLEQVSSAIFLMQRNMVEGGPKVEAGFQRIGLSIADIRRLTPDQQFLAIADAIKQIGDPAERSAAAMEIFGRQGRELLPLLSKDLEGLVAQSEALGLTWSEHDAKAAEAFEMKTRALDLAFQNLKTTIGRELVPAFSVGVDFAIGSVGWLLTAAPVKQFITDMELLNAALGKTKDILPQVKVPAGFGITDDSIDKLARTDEQAARLASHLEILRLGFSELSPANQAFAREMHEGGDSAKEIADLLGVAEGSVKRYLIQVETLAKAQADADAIALAGFEKKLQSIDAITKANLKAYDFGAQVASLRQLEQAEMDVARAVYDQLTSEKDRAKVIADVSAKRIEIELQIQAIEQKHVEVVNKAIIAEIEARLRLDAAQGLNTQGYYGEIFASDKLQIALDELHRHRQAGISQMNQEIEIEQRLFKALADEAEARQKAAAAARGEQDIYKDLNDVALMSNDDWLNKLVKDHEKLAGAIQATTAAQKAAVAAFSIDPSALSPELGGTQGAPGSYQYEQWQNLRGIFTNNLPPAARASGGPVDAGSPYMVGERGPELFVPSSSGSIVPNGGTGMTVQIYVTQPLGSPDAIASAVSLALEQRLRNQGMRMPSGV